MPQFEYKCGNCNAVTCEWRTIDERHNPFSCPLCKAECTKIFSRPLINCDLIRDRPENKWGMGNDRTEILNTMRADEKSYNDHWDGKWKQDYSEAYGRDIPHETVSKEPTTSMLDTAKRKGITLG